MTTHIYENLAVLLRTRVPTRQLPCWFSKTVLRTPSIGERPVVHIAIVCGFWQGDKAVLGQMVWVSEAYAKENCYPVTQKELKNGIYNGGKEYSVWYKNLWNLEKKTENISKTAGFTKARTGLEINPAYNLFEEDSFSFTSLIVMVLFVILAGYLIIYNIFKMILYV